MMGLDRIEAAARAADLLFRAAEKSAIARAILRRAALAFVDDAVRAWREGGVAAWDAYHLPVARAAGHARAARLASKLALDSRSARSLAQVHSYEDPLLGIEGVFTELGRERAVRLETRCPLGDRLRTLGCPDFCRVLVRAFEEETLREIAPAWRLDPLDELISAGHERCRFVHRIVEAKSEAKRGLPIVG
jgi:hypothetical protein